MPITRTPMIDDDGSGTTGTIINNAWKQEFYNQIDGLAGGLWTPYTPTWKASGGTQPALGNGTIEGRYCVQGRTVHFVLGLFCGSTTTFGTAGNIYQFGLPPFNPLSAAGITTYNFQSALLNAAGGAQLPMTTLMIVQGEFYGVTSAGGAVGPTVPVTWASGFRFTARGTYDY